jgi:hypothetical protein
MDWIEQWFGFAPDHGDGSLEMLLMLAAAAAVLVAAAAVAYRKMPASLRSGLDAFTNRFEANQNETPNIASKE